MDSISTNPPFDKAFKTLMEKTHREDEGFEENELVEIEECEVPVIDLSPLLKESNNSNDEEVREKCKSEIARACREWGFFHVVKHGISSEVLNGLRIEQEKVFKIPFDEKKKNKNSNFNFFSGSYRWGSPTATSIRQFSWSEAFHMPLAHITGSTTTGPNNTLTYRIEQFSCNAYNLAQTLAGILAEKIGQQKKSKFFRENCLPTTSYLRMNRYPPFAMASPSQVHGLIPHTDSCFLTILLHDQVRGLQLVKDGKWIAVKPTPHALTINIGDLFQAWSNDVYKSVEHRVVTNREMERFSIAYFFCPFDETVIESCSSEHQHSVYRRFSYREYRQKVQDDVHKFGTKIGLPNFLLHPS
ncbi:hypothetical protein PIB30_075597 [Stylosanthes scabra]|uniref:Fe2OG dioxygenase domain-containing protein n=1 Tax=Stylosanthes scabra TaxID=79078 RepID=A0ABU6RPW5_9FABA|nr:hypothetical protein [Stylosanthes scabra]